MGVRQKLQGLDRLAMAPALHRFVRASLPIRCGVRGISVFRVLPVPSYSAARYSACAVPHEMQAPRNTQRRRPTHTAKPWRHAYRFKPYSDAERSPVNSDVTTN